MSGHRQYSDAMLAGMQAAYGDGFLSPGAAPDVRRLLDGIDVANARMLDLGCGVGGASVMFAGEFGARRVTAADPEPAALEQTRRRAAAAGLADRVETVEIEPGRLPFAPDSFDIAYSKDVICHVADKAALFANILDVLVPGGLFVLGDWTVGSGAAGADAFAQWERHLAEGGLRFRFEPAGAYETALREAGFASVETIDRTPLFLQGAAGELAALEEAGGAALETSLGTKGAARRIALTRIRHEALALDGLAYHHFRARKAPL